MISILTPGPRLQPAVKRKIAAVRLFGITCVLGIFLLAIASFPMRYLPSWVFWPALVAEALLAPYVIRKIYLLRKPS